VKGDPVCKRCREARRVTVLSCQVGQDGRQQRGTLSSLGHPEPRGREPGQDSGFSFGQLSSAAEQDPDPTPMGRHDNEVTVRDSQGTGGGVTR